MANVYIEARPKGRPEGSPIDDYVVETQGDEVLGTFTTQKAAIDWAKANGHSPHVARVRHLNDKRSLITGGQSNEIPSIRDWRHHECSGHYTCSKVGWAETQ